MVYSRGWVLSRLLRFTTEAQRHREEKIGAEAPKISSVSLWLSSREQFQRRRGAVSRAGYFSMMKLRELPVRVITDQPIGTHGSNA